MNDEAVPNANDTAPPTWKVLYYPTDEDTLGYMSWESDASATGLLGGLSLAGFSVWRPAAEYALQHGHWAAYMTSAEQPYYEGVLEPDDATASVPPSSVNAHGVVVRPNPATAQATISFKIPSDGTVKVEIFDVSGRAVRSLFERKRPAGEVEVVWDGKDDAQRKVAAGTYFVRVKTPTIERFARVTVAR